MSKPESRTQDTTLRLGRETLRKARIPAARVGITVSDLFTEQLERVTVTGLRNRRNQPLSSQAIGTLLRNQLYAGIVDVPEYGVRRKRGDFEPIITEHLFQRARPCCQAASRARRLRAHPDFPLRNFVRCASCNRGLPKVGRVAATTTRTTTAGPAAAV